MNNPRVSRSLLLALLCLLSTAGCARECSLQVEDGWVRMPPAAMQSAGMAGMPGMAMLAGFGRIENRCATPVTIVSVSSPAFANATLHQTTITGGINRMRPVPELRIAGHGSAVLQPGGLHLMLMQPRAPVEPGSKLAIIFTLKDGRVLQGQFEARRP